jgi:hypothetical protein
MKLVYCDNRATFVGWHIACKDGEIQQDACPELPRALKGSGISCSAAAKKAAREGDEITAKHVGASSCMARAAEFSGILPTVSRKYQNYAMSLVGGEDFQDREMSMRTTGEEGISFLELNKSVDANNALVDLAQEKETLVALGYEVTDEEYDKFVNYPWHWDTKHCYADFNESLPRLWR